MNNGAKRRAISIRFVAFRGARLYDDRRETGGDHEFHTRMHGVEQEAIDRTVAMAGHEQQRPFVRDAAPDGDPVEPDPGDRSVEEPSPRVTCWAADGSECVCHSRCLMKQRRFPESLNHAP